MQEENKTAHDAIRFTAADGYVLGGSYFPALGGSNTPVLICPATGVKQGFYYAFAQWLSEQGHPVMVFDYRGVGVSLAEAHVRYSKARKQDWGECDMPAALNWLLAKTAAQQAHVIGHSAGGVDAEPPCRAQPDGGFRFFWLYRQYPLAVQGDGDRLDVGLYSALGTAARLWAGKVAGVGRGFTRRRRPAMGRLVSAAGLRGKCLWYGNSTSLLCRIPGTDRRGCRRR
ncbi:pimeloyl-ACP methyl ester carboxylesterase [Serratia sp. 121840015-2]